MFRVHGSWSVTLGLIGGLAVACSPRATPPGSVAESQGSNPAVEDPAIALADTPVAEARSAPAPAPPAPGGAQPAAPHQERPSANPPPATAGQLPSTGGGPEDEWVTYDEATRTVSFKLVAGPFNFNGYTSGGATLVVPPLTTVVSTFINKDGTPHSAEVISGEGPIPNAADEPAIPRAYTNKVQEGLPQEAKDVMRFPVPERGTYRIFCGVPGHGLSGMWIWLKVDPAAATPSFGPTR